MIELATYQCLKICLKNKFESFLFYVAKCKKNLIFCYLNSEKSMNWLSAFSFNALQVSDVFLNQLFCALLSKTLDNLNVHISDEKSLLTLVVAIAALFANFIVVTLVNHYGIRLIFTVLGLFSAIATWFIPTAIRVPSIFMLSLCLLNMCFFLIHFICNYGWN